MKLKFSLKHKEASIETNVEKLVEKKMDYNSKKPAKKTRYQIRQEEKRKNKELEFKHKMQIAFFGVGCIVLICAFAIIASALGL